MNSLHVDVSSFLKPATFSKPLFNVNSIY
ncbi:unnamed protein product [Prunus armeniaca]